MGGRDRGDVALMFCQGSDMLPVIIEFTLTHTHTRAHTLISAFLSLTLDHKLVPKLSSEQSALSSDEVRFRATYFDDRLK